MLPQKRPELAPLQIERISTPDTAAGTASELRTPRSDWAPENDNDGIRVRPVKSISKKRSKQRDAPANPGFEIEIEFPSAARTTSAPVMAAAKPAESRVRVGGWGDSDGIRIYTSSPIKSTDRKRSVRHSAKTVRSRKEQFEASSHETQLEIIRQRGEEGDDEDETEVRSNATLTAVRALPARDIEGSTVVDSEPAQKRWESSAIDSATTTSAAAPKYDDYDDGIRVRPIKKSKSTRRKRSPDAYNTTRLRDMIASSGMDDSNASETIIELPPRHSNLTESAPAVSRGVETQISCSGHVDLFWRY